VAQVGEDGEHPPMRARIVTQAELQKGLGDMRFDGPLGDVQALRDGLVRPLI